MQPRQKAFANQNHITMKRVFFDLETLGRGPDALIMSCGISTLSDQPGISGHSIVCTELFPSIGQQIAKGRRIEYETVKWWVTENPPSYPFEVGDDKRLTLNAFCSKLLIYTNGAGEICSNSPSFDLAIIRNLFDSCGFSEPWPFWKEEDFRTIKKWNRSEYEKFKALFYAEAKGNTRHVPHSALFDVEFMAEFVASLERKAL